MTTKHTPGPWTITRKHTPPIFDRGCIAIGPDIAAIQVPELDTASEANARLIASSPELLAALQILMGLFRPGIAKPDEVAKWDKARSAIAKATGGSL